MLKQLRMNPLRERVLDSVLSREEKAEAATEFGRWQAAVRRIGDLEAERDRILPELEREEDAALAELRRIEPAYRRACSRYGHAKRRHANTRRDFSYELTSRVNAAEAAAPEPLRRLRRELADIAEQTRRTRIETIEEPTGKLDKRGKPIYRTRTTAAAIAARGARLRALSDECELLKTKPCDDLDAALAAIRSKIPPATYELDK